MYATETCKIKFFNRDNGTCIQNEAILRYLQKRLLENFLLDGNLELSNNRTERSIKPFVLDRKNFLFANMAKGAKASAVMFSLIETAKENKLDPFKYLVYIFTNAPTQADWGNPAGILAGGCGRWRFGVIGVLLDRTQHSLALGRRFG